ncbi:MAG: outer membrane beta-barrel protein [Pseudomonadota bacterium]
MIKKVLITAVLGVSALGIMAANAAIPGAYITGQLGYANTHLNTEDKLKGSGLVNNGLAGRLAIGYQFTPNWAVELGYLKLRSTKTDIPPGPTPFTSFHFSQYAIDVAAKATLPLSNQFNAYGKVGVAYLTSTIQSKGDNGEAHLTAESHDRKWAPEAAVGVSYDITPNVSVDTSWTHIQQLGNDRDRPGNIDFVAVGVGYNFG